MSNTPDDWIYSQQHIWLQMETDNIAKMGITEYAQLELGDIVYVEMPEVENSYDSGQACAVVESVNTATDIHAPVMGKVVEINEEFVDSPELLNKAPYAGGWICKIELQDKTAIDSLMNASHYDSYIST